MKAQFDGVEREFSVPPEDIGVFEACLPTRSAYALLKQFAAGQWSARDISTVLSLALHGPSKAARQDWRTASLMARYTGAGGGVVWSMPTPHPDVVAVVARDGPGNFAELVVDILTEVVFRRKQEAADDAAA